MTRRTCPTDITISKCAAEDLCVLSLLHLTLRNVISQTLASRAGCGACPYPVSRPAWDKHLWSSVASAGRVAEHLQINDRAPGWHITLPAPCSWSLGMTCAGPLFSGCFNIYQLGQQNWGERREGLQKQLATMAEDLKCRNSKKF